MAFIQQNRDREVDKGVIHLFDRPVSTILELDLMQEKKRLEMYKRTGRHAQGISVRMDRNLFSGRSEIDRSMIMLPESPKNVLEQEKRNRRKIANSNERRRMQGINDGIQVLLQLLPDRGGEKLSKAAILQNAAELVNKLENERSLLREQNRQLCKRMASSLDILNLPSPKKRRRETPVDFSTGRPNVISVDASENAKYEMMNLKRQLQLARAERRHLEEKILSLECHLKQLDSMSNSANRLHSRDHDITEDSAECSDKILRQDEVPRSPATETFIQNSANDHHVACQSPSSPISENSRELSESDNGSLLHCADGQSIPDATPIPRTFPSQSPPNYSFPVEYSHRPHHGYDVYSTPKKNLQSIVKAIELVEGPNIFHSPKSYREKEQYERHPHNVTAAVPQVIPNSLRIQARPGVIVANHS